jgi:glycosidase
VEKENSEQDSLLNTILTLLKIRKQEKALQEGSLELIDNLPNGVLGYSRTLGKNKLIILLNFENDSKRFQFDSSECIFKLTDEDEIKNKAIRLNGFGGIITRIVSN